MSKLIDIRLNKRWIKIDGKTELVKETELILITVKPTYVLDLASETPTAKREYITSDFRIDLTYDEMDIFIKSLQEINKLE